MPKFKVSFRASAATDLFGLYRYIADEAGLEVAGAYIERIEAACLALATFPHRGTRRDDLRKGVRTIGFEGRATIVFEAKRSEVVITRIFYGGRNVERILRATLKRPGRRDH